MRNHQLKIIAAIIILAMLVSGCLSIGGEVTLPAEESYFTATLSVRVDTLLDNIHLLDREKHELVPVDGIIFYSADVIAGENDSVFDILHYEMRRTGIHLAFRTTPFLDTAYIQAINNIYEFDAGELSGWMYLVNGDFPGISSSLHLLSPGDVIEWVYTLDLGRDIGGYESW